MGFLVNVVQQKGLKLKRSSKTPSYEYGAKEKRIAFTLLHQRAKLLLHSINISDIRLENDHAVAYWIKKEKENENITLQRIRIYQIELFIMEALFFFWKILQPMSAFILLFKKIYVNPKLRKT